jgi:prophage regulatory protein
MKTTAFLRLPAVEARTGLKRSTLYARIAAGTFPKPYKLGLRASGWAEDEVDEWLARIREPFLEEERP